MNPKNWSTLCWALLAIWLTPFLFGRMPFIEGRVSADQDSQVDGVVKRLADGTEVVMYVGGQAGFPFHFVEMTRYSNGETTRRYSLGKGVLNLVLVGFTLAGIVVVVQQSSSQFSIRTLMLLTAGFTGLVLLGKSSQLSFASIMKVAYFTPLIAGSMMLVLKSRFFRRRKSVA